MGAARHHNLVRRWREDHRQTNMATCKTPRPQRQDLPRSRAGTRKMGAQTDMCGPRPWGHKTSRKAKDVHLSALFSGVWPHRHLICTGALMCSPPMFASFWADGRQAVGLQKEEWRAYITCAFGAHLVGTHARTQTRTSKRGGGGNCRKAAAVRSDCGATPKSRRLLHRDRTRAERVADSCPADQPHIHVVDMAPQR